MIITILQANTNDSKSLIPADIPQANDISLLNPHIANYIELVTKLAEKRDKKYGCLMMIEAAKGSALNEAALCEMYQFVQQLEEEIKQLEEEINELARDSSEDWMEQTENELTSIPAKSLEVTRRAENSRIASAPNDAVHTPSHKSQITTLEQQKNKKQYKKQSADRQQPQYQLIESETLKQYLNTKWKLENIWSEIKACNNNFVYKFLDKLLDSIKDNTKEPKGVKLMIEKRENGEVQERERSPLAFKECKSVQAFFQSRGTYKTGNFILDFCAHYKPKSKVFTDVLKSEYLTELVNHVKQLQIEYDNLNEEAKKYEPKQYKYQLIQKEKDNVSNPYIKKDDSSNSNDLSHDKQDNSVLNISDSSISNTSEHNLLHWSFTTISKKDIDNLLNDSGESQYPTQQKKPTEEIGLWQRFCNLFSKTSTTENIVNFEDDDDTIPDEISPDERSIADKCMSYQYNGINQKSLSDHVNSSDMSTEDNKKIESSNKSWWNRLTS